MPKISAVIITFNEELFIENCLLSLKNIADEIVVVDSLSTDRTEEICRNHNVKFVSHKFEGYVEQKNFALTQASYPHVLSLDADEALSEELVRSIQEVKEAFRYDGYIFKRRNNYCGHWIKHTGLFPEKKLRLFDSRKGKWMGPNPHDQFILNNGSRSSYLKGFLLHWNISNYEEHIEKINKFSTIGALEAYKAGKKASFLTPILHMFWSFFRSYILGAGFLQGHIGYVRCSISAYSSFLKYAKLRKHTRENRANKNLT
jgi:glycosyltransferase involved in cell wall biosynthesis